MTGVAALVVTEFFADVQRMATSNVQRLLFSVLVVVGVFAVRFATRYWKSRNPELGSHKRLLISTVVATTTAAGVLSVLAIWGFGDALLDALSDAEIADHFADVVLAVILLASAYALTDFLGGVIREVSMESTAITDHQEEMLRRILQVTVYLLVVLVIFGLFTDNVGSLLVGAGFLGIVVGMAARQTLGAVIAGFVLMFSRPFEVGDWVAIDDFEGTVTEITIINTRLRSFDGEVVTLPNDEVRSSVVVDRSRRNRLRIGVEIGVDYDADLNRARKTVMDAVSEIEDIERMPEPDVVAKRFGDSAVVLGLRYWIKDPSMRKRWRTQTAAMTAMKSRLEEEGITIPFPQQTLSAREGEFGVELDSDIGRDANGGTNGEGSR